MLALRAAHRTPFNADRGIGHNVAGLAGGTGYNHAGSGITRG
ncbi:hypothetical protein AMC99_02256 [Altererythrobacter epoxidivorans]|uniref:Uncharacterized protein n=1 Tax=Altererythrobacter epoxidivorans TaxID=361183 RepID=A0A0M4MV71_9SPHN|nr:hypothetical protein AMC99_02256 [Altererythrobacter epoxidivorans]